VIALHEAGAAVKIVAGGGIEGCGIVSQPGPPCAREAEGTTLGTFQMDSLEVMAYDWLRAHGTGFDEITVRYMGATPEAVEAFKAGALDWICTIEPYVTALARDVAGAHVLSRGRDIYGAGYTDCVLTAQDSILERDPAAVKAVIKTLMKAQHAFETERGQVLSVAAEGLLRRREGKQHRRKAENGCWRWCCRRYCRSRSRARRSGPPAGWQRVPVSTCRSPPRSNR
jgi:NitT/TauT family transport system substrate-binding protein